MQSSVSGPDHLPEPATLSSTSAPSNGGSLAEPGTNTLPGPDRHSLPPDLPSTSQYRGSATGKRVQFSETNSPTPAKPSPTFSVSSLPSTPLPSPPLLPEMMVHSFLQHSPLFQPEITYDISLPMMAHNLDFLNLAQSATSPPLHQLTLVCPRFLQYPIVVHASPQSAFVSVRDVLDTIISFFMMIYRELRHPVTQVEYESLGPVRQAVDAAYFARIRRITDPHHRDLEARQGVRRIDFLMGRTRFNGLSFLMDAEVWELHVS
ncbi:hypothetical protein FA15DRAFT_650875 [Coprinopsis marcescibilis]|uniref:DUF6699 domain-containing protein n=1 Tax=Coprinopsis marcescibilis TaxID=230819 RepID=A0A5C3K9E8_COPMA|nr:hypothetical protein FA15DRAFT_650875 [Coprinopsis marcescibilis]